MNQLPDDVIKYILGYVCNIDILSLSLTSKENKKVYSQIFYQRFVKDFNKMNGFPLINNIIVIGSILSCCLFGLKNSFVQIYYPLSKPEHKYLADLFEEMDFDHKGTYDDCRYYTKDNKLCYLFKSGSVSNRTIYYRDNKLVIFNPLRYIDDNKKMLEIKSKKKTWNNLCE